MTSKWFGKIAFRDEGVVACSMFDTLAEAMAYEEGVRQAFAILNPDEDSHYTVIDQIPMEEE